MSEFNIILPVSSCRANLLAITSTLEIQPPQEPNQIIERLNDLASLLGTSAQTVASYQYHVDTEKFIAVQEAKKQGYAPSMAKDYAEGRCAQIRAESKLAERQNAALVHAIDITRSILSYTKQELFASNLQQG